MNLCTVPRSKINEPESFPWFLGRIVSRNLRMAGLRFPFTVARTYHNYVVYYRVSWQTKELIKDGLEKDLII